MSSELLFSSEKALHRYWMYANRMRNYFEAALKRAAPKLTEPSKDPAETVTRSVSFMADDPGIFMSYWYGALYVVVEGWRELGLHDLSIDKLLQSPNVDLLRRYRNGVFHFQKNYFDERLAGFMKSEDSVPWVRELTSTLGGYFLREAAKRGNAEALKYYNRDGSERRSGPPHDPAA